MLSTRTSRWVAGTAGTCVLLAAGSWFLLVGPRLDHAAELRDQTASARSQNDQLELQIAQLKAQFAELPKKKAELAAVNKEFPAVAQVPALLRKVNGLAGGTGVVVTKLAPGQADYLRAAAAAPGAPAAPAGSTPPGSAPAAPAPAAGAGVAPGAPAVPGTDNLVAIPLTLTVTGDYFQTIQFVKQVQTQLTRAFLVTAVSVDQEDGTTGTAAEPSAGDPQAGGATTGKVRVQLTGQIFALPDRSTAPAVGTGTPAPAVPPATATGTDGGTT